MSDTDNIESNLDIDIIFQFLLDYLNEHKFLGIVPTEITYAKFVKHHHRITIMLNYTTSEEFEEGVGNTGLYMDMDIYNKAQRSKNINSVLDVS